ncbi:MAG: cupin domain-containing protein [Candidatus Hodarchaeota archaeon]
MSKLTFNKIEKENFTVIHIESLEELDKCIFEHPKVPTTRGKLFLKNELKLSGMEVSINKLSPGMKIPFYHKHKENEELYIFIKGKGQFQIDGEIIKVQEGTVIRVSPDGVRAWRNNSSEDLYFIVIQVKPSSFLGENISDGVSVEGDVTWL